MKEETGTRGVPPSGGTDNLGTGSVGRLVFRMALPIVVAQLINVLYNIVDRIYIGRMEGVGSLALSGVGITFPIIVILSAFAALVGTGGAPLASIKLGEGNREGAERILNQSFILLTVFAVVLGVLFYLLKDAMLYAFGASENTFSYGSDYLGLYLIGTLFVFLSQGLNTYLSAQGYAIKAMATVGIGAIVNIALDPLFIFTLQMGVKGAAVATVISQAVSAACVIRFLCGRRAAIRIRPGQFRISPRLALSIMALGVSPFIMQATESLVQITLNAGLQRYGGELGDLYVGSMTIILSVTQLLILPMSGFTTGAQPVFSYNYGAGNFDRVRRAVLFVTLSSTAFAFVLWGMAQLFPGLLARLFTDDAELIELTAKGLRVFSGGMCLLGLQFSFQSFFVGTRQVKTSLFLALVRKVVLFIPLALILPVFLGVEGIFWSSPAADIGAVITTSAFFAARFRGILKARADALEEEARTKGTDPAEGADKGETGEPDPEIFEAGTVRTEEQAEPDRAEDMHGAGN